MSNDSEQAKKEQLVLQAIECLRKADLEPHLVQTHIREANKLMKESGVTFGKILDAAIDNRNTDGDPEYAKKLEHMLKENQMLEASVVELKKSSGLVGMFMESMAPTGEFLQKWAKRATFPVSHPLALITQQMDEEDKGKFWGEWIVGSAMWGASVMVLLTCHAAVFKEPHERGRFEDRLNGILYGDEAMPKDSVIRGPMPSGRGHQNYLLVAEHKNMVYSNRYVTTTRGIEPAFCKVATISAYPIKDNDPLIETKTDYAFSQRLISDCRGSRPSDFAPGAK